MNEPESGQRPSFSGPLQAAWRQGLKELGAVLPAFPESVRPIEEPGTLGNPTPQMVTEQIAPRGEGRDFENRLDGYAARSGSREPQQEMER